MLFNQLGLTAELLRAVQNQGYETATPVQHKAIPPILEGRDILAGAQTGTGKTAGFTLPLLQHLQTNTSGSRRVRALILVPTRELAAQVHESVRNYGRHLNYQSMEIYGGVSSRPQESKLRRGVDIIVATPGRLLDHVQRRNVDLSGIEILVLDEADRMLDMGFIRDIRKIVKELPEERQSLMFSATFSNDIRRLANDFLIDPIEIQVAQRNTTAERVKQFVYPVDKRRKRELLSELIGRQNWQQVLVFTRTKHGANRLAGQLIADGIETSAIHGNKSQAARTKALTAFKAGKVRVLVATDIAARGLDIDKLPHVVNYELPHVPEDYIHRIGRTARAGREGEAVSLVCIDEKKLLKDIESLLKTHIEKIHMPGYEIDPRIKAEPLRQAGPQRSKRPAGGGRNNAHRGKPASRSGTSAFRGGNPNARGGQRKRSGGRKRRAS